MGVNRHSTMPWLGTLEIQKQNGNPCHRARLRHTLGANAKISFPLTQSQLFAATFRTTRNRALPLIIRSYASAAFSIGKTSFMECTPANALNSSVSCQSMDVPEYQPFTDRQPVMSRIGSTEIGPAAPITMSTPFGASPPRTAAIASAFVTVAITTLAPPSLFSSAAGSDALLSM